MIPILYEKTETNFDTLGVCRLSDIISCVVTEERNGIFECEFEYPVSGANFDKIVPGRIIYCWHDDTEESQPFDIVSYSKPINGVVTFHAVHVSYRQSYLTVSGTSINSLADAFAMLKRDAVPSNPFSYQTEKTTTGYMAAADGTPRSVRQMLGGVEGSILDAYGGEYEWDGWTVRLHNQRGQLRDFAIRYGVNMTAYQDDTDYQGTFSSCVAFWRGADDTGADVIVKTGKIESGNQTYTGRGECVPLDLSEKFENKPTVAQLTSMAQSMMQGKGSILPEQNIKVEFINLSDFEETGSLSRLMSCHLCDVIPVKFPAYGMEGDYKIVRTVYDVLAERYESMELGSLSVSLADALGVRNAIVTAGGGGGGGDHDNQHFWHEDAGTWSGTHVTQEEKDSYKVAQAKANLVLTDDEVRVKQGADIYGRFGDTANIALNRGTIAAKNGQLAIGTYNLEDTSATTQHPDNDPSHGLYAFILGNGISDSDRRNAFTIAWNGNVVTNGNIDLAVNSRGIVGRDAAGNRAILLVHNPTNLWIGAGNLDGYHHVGRTLISSGYDSANGEGYKSIKVAVPNAANNNATEHFVFHEGYKPTRVIQQSYNNVACTTRSGGGAYYSGNLTLPTSIPAGATILSVMVANFSGAAASFVPCYNGTRLFLISDVSQTIGTAILRFAYQI